ncbi:MAG: hypothetical protein Q9159_002586 [Coniocarpon cinnabarinum]
MASEQASGIQDAGRPSSEKQTKTPSGSGSKNSKRSNASSPLHSEATSSGGKDDKAPKTASGPEPDATQRRKRKSADNDNATCEDSQQPAQKSPKLEDTEHGEVAVKERLNAILNDPDSYCNRDNLSPIRELDRKDWAGWIQMAAEPQAIQIMLHELGVKDVVVTDLFGFDEASVLMLPGSPVAFIRCFPHAGTDPSRQVSCPREVWFANQTHRNICGSNALINVLMNVHDIILGDFLQSFKDFTKDLTPYQRGNAVGNWEFLRRIHNLGMRKMEMLVGDVAFMHEFSTGEPSQNSVKSPIATSSPPKGKDQVTSARKGPLQGGGAGGKKKSDNGNGENHYAAYVFISGNVWKLDGLDRHPSKLDECDESTFATTAARIIDQEVAKSGGLHVNGIMAICRDEDQLELARKQLARSINELNDVRNALSHSNDTDDDNNGALISKAISGPTKDYGVSQYDIDNAPTTSKEVTEAVASSDNSKLQALQEAIIAKQQRLVQTIVHEKNVRAQKEETVRLARHDYEPLVRTWLQLLANKEGVMEGLVEVVKDEQKKLKDERKRQEKERQEQQEKKNKNKK